MPELEGQKKELVSIFGSITAENAHELMKLIEAPNYIKFKTEIDIEGNTYKLDFKFEKQ